MEQEADKRVKAEMELSDQVEAKEVAEDQFLDQIQQEQLVKDFTEEEERGLETELVAAEEPQILEKMLHQQRELEE